MELALLAGAVYGGIYAVLTQNKTAQQQQPPAASPIDPDTRTTLNIRTRIDDAIGSGAEIGAAPFDEGQDPMALLADQTAAIDRPNALPVPPQPMPEPQPSEPVPRPIDLAPVAPLRWPEPSADPNALAPGVVTILPIKRYPLPDRAEPPVQSVRPVPAQDGGPSSVAFDLSSTDLSAMNDDALRRRAQLTSAAPAEPADNVVHAAAAVQAAVTAPKPRLTAEQRADAVVQAAKSGGSLKPESLTKPKNEAEIDAARTAYVANGGRYTKLQAPIWRQILAHKLGCDSGDRQLGPLVTKLRAL